MNIYSVVLSEVFWSRVRVTYRHRCWQWTGSKDQFGYGKIKVANSKDMVAKGRNRPVWGESHPSAVLTDEKVKGMRRAYRSGNSSLALLAKKFNCSFSTAQRAVTGQSWRHVK